MLSKLSITICKGDSGSVSTLEGWGGEGDGREVQNGGDIHLPMVDSCWGLIKKQQNSVQLSFNK